MTGRSGQASGSVTEGSLLWEPSAERIANALITRFLAWLSTERDLVFASYEDLWRWSVEHLEEFWLAIWDYFDVKGTRPSGRVLLETNCAEGAVWFPGTVLNYVEQVTRHPHDATALLGYREQGEPVRLTYGDIERLAGAAAAGLRRLGVVPGDRVAAVLPNGPHAVIGFLACASLGAIWSSCAPEFGAPSMVDRFKQIAPRVLLIASGYRYRGRSYPLDEKLADLERELSSLSMAVVVPEEFDDITLGEAALAGSQPSPRPGTSGGSVQRISWDELVAERVPLVSEPVSFSHPLWILYSSGTTGLPKPIVQGHGGILLEHLKVLTLHSDLGPGECFFWFTTTGWMMWNFLVGGLLVGSTIVCYDGDPNWPDASRLWRLAAEAGITYFGTSAPYLEGCRRSGTSPRDVGDLKIHTVGSTGAPLSPEGFEWTATHVANDVLVGSVSGGTDVCTGFLTSCPLLPVRAGELQCCALGAKVEAFDEDGRGVVGEVGELVITEPMPSMPIMLWGDDGTRLHESYFDRFPGVWRHGDWVKITPQGSAVLYGRSDATLNRGGVRMGTAEFYRVVEALPEVADSLVVDTSGLGRDGELLLFVVPSNGGTLSGQAEKDIRKTIRDQLSPRHVPDRVLSVSALPRTINGKKLEVPVRRILLGTPLDRAVSEGALADPKALQEVLGAIERRS